MRILQKIAIKNVWRNRKRSLISMMSIAISVMTITLLFAWLAALRQDVITNLVNHLSGHIRIRHSKFDDFERLNPLAYSMENISAITESLQSLDYVHALSPRISAAALLYLDKDESLPVHCIGVHPSLEQGFYDPPIIQGKALNAPSSQTSQYAPAMVSSGLDRRFTLAENSTFTLLAATMMRSSNARSFQVQGVTHFPLASLNTATILIPLDAAQKLFRMPDRATELLVKIDPKTPLQEAVADIRSLLPTEISIVAWNEIDSSYTWIRTAEISYTIIAFIFFLLGSVSMINTTMMAVFERQHEIGMMLALGMDGSMIRLLFFLESLIIGLFGSLVGAILGIGIVVPLSYTGIDVSSQLGGVDMGISNFIYPQLDFTSTGLALVYAIFVVALVGYLSCRRASKLDPVQALRHET